jgi:hypothetical protein
VGEGNTSNTEMEISEKSKRSKAVWLRERVSDVWIAISLALFIFLRILESQFFRHLYARWKAF